MDSAGLRSVSAASRQAGDNAQKRKASDVQEADDASQKKQKAHRRRSLTQSKAKKAAESNGTAGTNLVVANGDKAPEPAGTILSTAPLALPAGQPPASSNSRAALCNSIEFWRAHQGGIHSYLGVATGMLLNGKTTPRDVLQGQVVVTTVGGGLKMGIDGKHIRIQDQRDNCKNYVCLKNAMDVGQPIGIVIGKQAEGKGHYTNNLLRVKLEYHYNVLDWFFITDIWSERQPTQRDGTSFAQYSVRLQRIKLDSTPWWVPQGDERIGMYAVGQFHCRTTTCQLCNAPSKEIFKEGWCCLTTTCPEFFHFSNLDIDINNLQYHENFLNERTTWTSERKIERMIPALPTIDKHQFGSEKAFKLGIICPTCKWASRRISWEGWTCEKGCGFKWPMPPRDITLDHIQAEVEKSVKRTKFFQVHAQIAQARRSVDGYEVTSFYLPNTPQNLHEAEFIGSVTIFRPTKSTLERRGGLDELFYEVQQATRVGDVKLQRNPAFCRGSHMEELTSHFSCNMGADYKFGVVVETSNGFETAPAPVLKALSRLTWGGATAVALTASHAAQNGLSIDSASMPDEFIDFNEQLMLGYFEGSQIGYHDDGEKELGPTVATLSLGSPSIMSFRAKKKAGFGEALSKDRVMLSFYLQHGDIVIMHGTKIHQHYEHSVTASGIRRFALTCRYIRPELISDPERREKAIVNGAVPLYWQKHAYTGESAEALDALSYDNDTNQSSTD
ncbi:hypothetical protein E0Z10_g4126 [Xylaria hypoxylon]|uniref:Alpha-ketoglutarate-dependent dioxygenase AlkB-like domain-containing protein n=1 Tax=Xylaria hypoxylon TaxID=37992 RepID=A0A4Z0Z807_9PEZI|nr:hypothetical protein E0Z10_g4126 [Xylaria hypoxylon]